MYETIIPGAGRIFSAFNARRPANAGIEIREKSYETKSDEKRRFEVHYRTIDLMIARSGSEIIHICPMEDLVLAEELPNGADGRKLDGAPQGSAVLLKSGYFCAIFPGEAHMVGGKIDGEDTSIDKWVVKVPAMNMFCAEEIV
jgi:YhcH/YjgK/YiaL family protein